MTKYKLWLEFEEVDPSNWDKDNEFANIQVELPNGQLYGINVWTYKFFETIVNKNLITGENLNGLYLTPPDLFVKELTRDCIEQTINELLNQGKLEDLLNPTIIGEQK